MRWPETRSAPVATTIFIVDDHEVIRQGVRAIVQKARPEWKIVGEAANGKDAIEAVARLMPNVVVMDVSMPEMNGLEASAEILKNGSGSFILIFSMHESEHFVDEVRRTGVHGCVQKSQAGRDLIRAIEIVTAGGTFFGNEPVAETKPKRKPEEGPLLRVALAWLVGTVPAKSLGLLGNFAAPIQLLQNRRALSPVLQHLDV
jgi:DNA-binding NarL/FixJ family response regulator